MTALRGLVNRGFWHARTRAAALGVTSAGVAWIGAVALAERARVTWMRATRRRPRLVWGPSAILNAKHWSAAARGLGYRTVTYAHSQVHITSRGDFDLLRDDLLARTRVPEPLRPYLPFVWALRSGDVLLTFFDGGYLRGTPLEWREHLFMRLAGKRLVVTSYGGDIAVPGHLGRLEEPLLADYPELPEHAALVERRVRYLSGFADVSIRTLQPGLQPFVNVLWGNQLCVDRGPEGPPPSDADGAAGTVRVVHAPNHREIKGTRHIEEAVRSLRDEGLGVELQVLEGVLNSEVRAAIARADIVADQLLFGYGLFATEGLMAGKPVISNLDHLPEVFRETPQMRDCPIVSSSPQGIEEDLRTLVTDPGLRHRIGAASAEFAAEHHSYPAVARKWDAIIGFAWSRKPLPADLAASPSTPPGASVRRSHVRNRRSHQPPR